MTSAAVEACPVCPEAARRAREAVGAVVYECECGRRYRVRLAAVWAPGDYAPPSDGDALEAPAPRARRQRVFHADPNAPAAPRSALERAGQRATALTVPEGEAEVARLRVVLADLRPDHPDPYAPMPSRAEAERAQTIRVHDPAGSWGGIPRALASPMAGMLARAELATRSGGDVMREVREHGGEAAPVLLWLRREATLAAGLRGLYCDAGGEFASAKQRAAWGLDAEEPTAEHLAARRDGAYAHGRRMVLAAAAVWEQVMRDRGMR